MAMTKDQALTEVLAALLLAVRAGGHSGVPGGVIYAALMTQGCSLEQFEALMGSLVRMHKVRKSGDCYFAA